MAIPADYAILKLAERFHVWPGDLVRKRFKRIGTWLAILRMESETMRDLEDLPYGEELLR